LLTESTELTEQCATLRHANIDSQCAITNITSASYNLGVQVQKFGHIYAQTSTIENPATQFSAQTWVQIHKRCHKIYPKTCHKIIL